MIYLTDEDLKADSFQRYIDESIGDFVEAKGKAEIVAISIAKTYLSGRYNTDAVFDQTSPIRNGLLTEILVKLTLGKIFGRNAARKLPGDIKEDYEWAIETLEKLNAGKLKIDLPGPVDENGNVKSTSMWGSNRNDNYFI